MDVFEKNIEAVKLKRPDLLAALQAYDQNKAKLSTDVTIGTQEIAGRDILYGVNGEKLYQLDSMYDSENMLKQWSENLEIVHAGRYYFLGFGNGMFARKLLEMIDSDSRVFVYEPSMEMLITTLNTFDIRNLILDERLTIFTKGHELMGEQLFSALGHSVSFSEMANIRKLTYVNYDILFPEQYAFFMDRVEEIITSMESNRSVYERFGEYFAINGIYNIPFIKESRDTYAFGKSLPKDFPAIIVSSGPSLMKNIELLHEIKGRAFIVATDSAVKVLLLHGLTPDVFVSVDANKSPKHYDDERIMSIPIVGDFSTCRGALEGHKGPYFFARTENPHILKFFEDKGIHMPKLGTGGSVANTSFSWLAELGVTRIILIGQDLAYTNDKSHADGATRASWGLDLDKNSVMIEGMDGNPIKSSGEFVHYRNWFERSIEACRDIDVINATEGGARIHGAREMTLREAIDSCCSESVDIAKLINECSYVLSDEEKREFEAYMGDIRGSIDAIGNELKNGVRVYDEMLQMVYEGKYQNQRFKTLFEKSSQIMRFVDNHDCLYYVECMVQKEMTELLRGDGKAGADERSELIEAIGEGKKRLELMLVGCRRIMEAAYSAS